MDPRELRNALGCFATGVTIVTAMVPDGEPVGLTANSFSSVSLTPPLVQFSLDRGALSLDAFRSAGSFAVNVLCEGQTELSNLFATRNANKFEDVPYTTWESGAPILEGALAHFDCDTYATYDGGDHLIFVGEVRRMAANRDGHPLLYFRGGYHTLLHTA